MAYTAGVVLSFLLLGGADAGACARPARRWAGAFSCSRRPWSPRWRLLFTLIGLNLAGVFEFGPCAALVAGQPAGAPSGGRQLSHRRAGRGRGLALHGALHGRFAGPDGDAAGPAGPGRVRGAGAGPGPALPGRQLHPGRRACPAAPRCLDGHLAQVHGVPDVRHGGLAGLGAGTAKRHRRRRRPADPSGGPLAGAVVAVAGRSHAPLPGRAVTDHAGMAGLGVCTACDQRGRSARAACEREGAVAGLVTGGSAEGPGQRPPGVCGFHRRLVRHLPVQQEDDPGRHPRARRLRRQERGPAAGRLDAPRPRHHRRAGGTGAPRRAGVRVLHAGPARRWC